MSCTRRSMVFLLLASAAFAAQWTPASAGLTGSIPAVSALVVDHSTGSTLFALTSLTPLRAGADAIDIFNVFKSTDGGANWKALANIARVNVVAIDPISASTIYAATAGGVFKSTDGGESWVSMGLSGTSISVLAIDPITPSNLYAAGDKFYRSTDAGASWTALNFGPVGSLAPDPLTPSTLYVVTNVIPPDALYRSTDGGQSWSVVSSGILSPLAIAPTTPPTLYAGRDTNTGSPGLSKSTDGGATWTRIGFTQFTQCVDFSDLAIDPTNPNTMYATTGKNACDGMPPAIFKSTDGGQSWNAVDTIIPAAASFVFSPGSSTIYAATGSGVFKSSDGGLNWGETNTGLRVFDIEVLVGDPINPATVYAGGNDGLFKSVDGGANWTHPYTLLGANSLLINFTHSNILYARKASPNGCSSTEIDLHKSTDGGSSWNELEPDAYHGCGDGGTMAMDPADPNTLYVVYGNYYDGFTIFKTTDGGAHWKNLYADAMGEASQVNALVIDPNAPATLYAATDIGVFRSTDAGASFLPAGFVNSRVLLLAIDPVRSNVLYAATSNNDWAGAPAFLGLYKSTDGGASWSPINQGLDEIADAHAPVNALVLDPDRPNILYLATSGYGVFKSSDGGATWAAFNSGLTNLDVRSLALVRPGAEAHRDHRPGALGPDTLYAGTPGGVFKIR
jgi:photosystem II stability/assembly factor-like uncharacterized protein